MSLRAEYSDPKTQESFEKPLPAGKDKRETLHTLRAAAKELQNDVNVFLTARMVTDKAAEKAEENYGEEVVE
jgi:hypothetical protein